MPGSASPFGMAQRERSLLIFCTELFGFGTTSVTLQYPRLLPLHIPWHGESGYIRNTIVPFRSQSYSENNWKGFLSSQMFPGTLKYCSSNNGCFMLTDRTSEEPSFHRPCLASTTDWANKAMRPTKFLQILKTSLFCCEPLVEFLQGFRIVNSGNWMGTKIIHTSL